MFQSVPFGYISLPSTFSFNVVPIYMNKKLFLGKNTLTFEIGQIFARETFELNAIFYQQRIVVNHSLMLSFCEGFLNMIAYVVDASCTNIATCAFQLMCTKFHLVPVL